MRAISRKLLKSIRRQASDCSGTAAIELAVVAPVFIALLLGAITIGWDFAAASSIDNAIVKISRQVEAHSKQPVSLSSVQDAFCKSTLLPGQCRKGDFVIQVGQTSNPGFGGDTASFAAVQPGTINVIRIITKKTFLSRLLSREVKLGAAFAVYVQ